MSNLDNQPDPSWTEVQKGNAQAEVMRKLIESKFPRTYRLLNGIRYVRVCSLVFELGPK
jgi:hypothetical protein